MTATFTKELRQEIVREFAVRHNGQFDPHLFLKEVEERGSSHPAHSWFEWNKAKAAHAWHIEQARDFARGLKVRFAIEEIGAERTVTVREREMPMVISPLAGRSKGGGYVLSDPGNDHHMAEHCRQAAAALDQWLNRYRSALEHAEGSLDAIREQIIILKKASATKAIEAA